MASFFGKLFGTPKVNVQQGPLRTPEMLEAQKRLLDYGKTGYEGSLGSYTMTGAEQAGQNKLLAMLQGANPAIFDAGVGELTSLLGTDKFDPYNERGVYSGFKDNVLRELEDAGNRLKRSASYTGNLYGTSTANRLGDLQEQGHKTLTGKLAELHDTFVNRKISAIPQAIAAGGAQEGIDLGRIHAASTIGAMPRTLADQEAKDRYAAFQDKMNANRTVATTPVQYGSENLSLPGMSPFQGLLDLLAKGGGAFLGARMGARAAG